MPNCADWKAGTRSFAEMAAYTDTSVILTGAGDPVRLGAIQITATLLPMLGAAPRVGRNFLLAMLGIGGTTAVDIEYVAVRAASCGLTPRTSHSARSMWLSATGMKYLSKLGAELGRAEAS